MVAFNLGVVSRKGHLDGILMLGELQNTETHAERLHGSLWLAIGRLPQRHPIRRCRERVGFDRDAGQVHSLVMLLLPGHGTSSLQQAWKAPAASSCRGSVAASKAPDLTAAGMPLQAVRESRC